MPIKLTEEQLAKIRRDRKANGIYTKGDRTPGQQVGNKAMDDLCRANGLPMPIYEYQFATSIGRMWAFDMCWPDLELALEIDGGAFAGKPCPVCNQRPGGRHNRGAGRIKDMEKLTAAAIMGWRIIYVTPQQVKSGEVCALIKQAMEYEG